jgi:hypothetical protein
LWKERKAVKEVKVESTSTDLYEKAIEDYKSSSYKISSCFEEELIESWI